MIVNKPQSVQFPTDSAVARSSPTVKKVTLKRTESLFLLYRNIAAELQGKLVVSSEALWKSRDSI